MTTVEADTPAAAAGLKPGDLIVAIDTRPVETVDDVLRMLAPDAIRRPVTITFGRDGRRMETTVTPREAP